MITYHTHVLGKKKKRRQPCEHFELCVCLCGGGGGGEVKRKEKNRHRSKKAFFQEDVNSLDYLSDSGLCKCNIIFFNIILLRIITNFFFRLYACLLATTCFDTGGGLGGWEVGKRSTGNTKKPQIKCVTI